MIKKGAVLHYKGSTKAVNYFFTVDKLYAVLECYGGIAKVICDNGTELKLHPTELKFFEEITVVSPIVGSITADTVIRMDSLTTDTFKM